MKIVFVYLIIFCSVCKFASKDQVSVYSYFVKNVTFMQIDQDSCIQNYGAGTLSTIYFECWNRNRSLKFEFPFSGRSLWSKPFIQTIQGFLVFNGPICFGARAINI